jgi:hypothetical protein
VCDWDKDCDWPDIFLIDKFPEEPARSCVRHLGVLALTKGVCWPLNIGWISDVPLPQALVVGKMGNPFPIIWGVVEDDVWGDDAPGRDPVQ